MNVAAGFHVGEWVVSPGQMSISRGLETVHLEPKVMDVLVKLASRSGAVVTRDEFMTEVWRGRVVTDEALSRCVSLLRLALRDNRKAPEFVQTVPKIGYRLVAATGPIEQAEALPVSTASPAPPDGVAGMAHEKARNRRTGPVSLGRVFLGIAAVAALLWLLGVFGASAPVHPGSTSLAARGPSLAVLPLVNVGGDPRDDYFSDGLTEDLINVFSRVKGLAVVARTSAFAYKKRTGDVREIGRRLGGAMFSMAVSGDRVRRSGSMCSWSTSRRVPRSGGAVRGRPERRVRTPGQITRSIVDVISPRLTLATPPAQATARVIPL